jgi:hypothetical protein
VTRVFDVPARRTTLALTASPSTRIAMDSDAFYIVTLFQQGPSPVFLASEQRLLTRLESTPPRSNAVRLHAHTAAVGSYRAALSAYKELSAPSPTLSLYAARSYLALSPPDIRAAQTLLSSLPSTLDSRAVQALATYLAGDAETAVGELEELLAELGEQGLGEGDEEGRVVRGVVGTVWILEGDEQRREEGIEVLREAVELGHDQEWSVPTSPPPLVSTRLIRFVCQQPRTLVPSLHLAAPRPALDRPAHLPFHHLHHVRLSPLPTLDRALPPRDRTDSEVPRRVLCL